jgi:hypothetical protein
VPTKASYSVNPRAVAQARRLIDAHQYALESAWGDVQPTPDRENAFLESHSWDDYAAWHLALTDGATDHTKARYAFRLRRLPTAPPDRPDRLPIPGRRMGT